MRSILLVSFVFTAVSGCAYDLAPLHGTGQRDSGMPMGDSGPTLPDSGTDPGDAGVDAAMEVADTGTDTGSDAGVGPTGLDPDYSVPASTTSVCASPASLCATGDAGFDGVCRPYSPTEHRCERAAGTCTGDSCPCTSGTDCSGTQLCFAGLCRAMCVLGTSRCGTSGSDPCLSLGDPHLGYCN